MTDDNVAVVPQEEGEHRENRKKNLGRKVEFNQARAVAKFIRVPPRKARLVMDEVRGQYVMDALAFLRFIPNRAAGYIAKVLASAVANAANNHNLDPMNLKLVEARVDEGPRLKRMHPRAQGRAYRIVKRTSHLTVIVQEVTPKPRKPRKQQTRSRAQAAREARQAPAAPAIAATSAAPVAVEENLPVVVEEALPATLEDVTPVAPAETEAAQTLETTPEADIEPSVPTDASEA
jgi:large subunit ribosomal protein L22